MLLLTRDCHYHRNERILQRIQKCINWTACCILSIPRMTASEIEFLVKYAVGQH